MDQLDEKERARQTNPADPDNLLVWSVISAGCFYREGMRPLKLAYNRDLEAAIVAGRQAERAEILNALERLWGSCGGAWREGVSEAIQTIKARGLAADE